MYLHFESHGLEVRNLPTSVAQSRRVHFPSICSRLTVSVESRDLNKLLLDPSGSSVDMKRMIPRPSDSCGGRTSQAPHAVKPAGVAPCKEVLQEFRVAMP